MGYRFGSCELDLNAYEFRMGGNAVHIEPRSFELLRYLIENRDRMVSKEEIFDHIWEGRIVSDSALSTQIKAIRKLVGDDGKKQSLIRTVHGKGFRFVGEVTQSDQPSSGSALSTPSPSVPTEGPGAAQGRPSLAVFPFENVGGDPEQEYFSDGITEDIITALSKYRWFFVAARNSTFFYKGQHTSVRQVAGELGVRYVLEGRIRRAGDRVRIGCELIDALSGHQLWSEKYDRELEDIFQVQDDISMSIVGAVAPEIGMAEEVRANRVPTDNLDAWDYHLRGMWHLWRYTPQDGARARSYFEKAIDLDPDLSSSHSGLSLILCHHVLMGWANDHAALLNGAHDHANRALNIDARDAFAHFVMGRVLTLNGDFEQAIAELNKAKELNPNFALTHFGLGFALVWFGKTAEAIPHLERAIQQSPNDPIRWSFEMMLGAALHWEERFDEAITALTQARRHPNADFWPSAGAAVTYVQMGELEKAERAVNEALAKRPELTISGIGEMMATVVPRITKTFLDNLRVAGMPE